MARNHEVRRIPKSLSERQHTLCETLCFDFSDLSALVLNCALKRSPEPSHPDSLLALPREIMRLNGVSVETVGIAERRRTFDVQHDMTKHGPNRDDWPALFEKVREAETLIIGTPIWLGEKSSV